jgi:predicted RNase H-like nuclease (RuvC/YqgF family)
VEEDADEETPAPTGGSQESVDREIKNLKALVAQQSRQLRDLTKTLSELAAEVKTLKAA